MKRLHYGIIGTLAVAAMTFHQRPDDAGGGGSTSGGHAEAPQPGVKVEVTPGASQEPEKKVTTTTETDRTVDTGNGTSAEVKTVETEQHKEPDKS